MEMRSMTKKRIIKYVLIILAFLIGNFLLWRFFIVKYTGDTVRVRMFDVLTNETNLEITYNIYNDGVYQITDYTCNTFDSPEELKEYLGRRRAVANRLMSENPGCVMNCWTDGNKLFTYETVDLRLLNNKQIKELGLSSYKNEYTRKRQIEGFQIITGGIRSGMWVD